jgi:hypothetical protein
LPPRAAPTALAPPAPTTSLDADEVIDREAISAAMLNLDQIHDLVHLIHSCLSETTDLDR